MPQYSSAKQAINAKLSGNTAMWPKNVPGTTGAVWGVAKPTPSIFDTPAAAGATLDINKTKPYNSLEYGQNTANLYPGSQFLQQAASGNQVSSGGQTTTRGNQTGMSTGMQTGYNQFGSPQAIQSQGYQAYSPISQGLADYNLSQPSTSGGSQAVKDAQKQSLWITQWAQAGLQNQFASGDYQGLTQSQAGAKSMEQYYQTKTDQQQQIEKAIAQKQALDLQQQELQQSYDAKTALTKMQYQTKIKDTADSLNKAQAGILEAVGNDIVNLTALSDAKWHIMTGQMILDNLSKSRGIDLDQIANEYTNSVQSATNTFLANNSRLGIAAAGMLKELESNGALDTAKGQAEAMALLQSTYSAIGQSAQGYAQSLQYINQYASQQADILYKNASLAENRRQFDITNNRLTAEANKPVVNTDGTVTYTNPATGMRQIAMDMDEYNNAVGGTSTMWEWQTSSGKPSILNTPDGTIIPTRLSETTNKNGGKECAEFVNDAIGKSLLGSSWASKLNAAPDKSGGIGSVAIWQPKWGLAEYGHAGVIVGEQWDNWLIKSSNYKLDWAVSTDVIPKSAIAGYNNNTWLKTNESSALLSNPNEFFKNKADEKALDAIDSFITTNWLEKYVENWVNYWLDDVWHIYTDEQLNQVAGQWIDESQVRQEYLANDKTFQKSLKTALGSYMDWFGSNAKSQTQNFNNFVKNVGKNPVNGLDTLAAAIAKSSGQAEQTKYQERGKTYANTNNLLEQAKSIQSNPELSKQIWPIQTKLTELTRKYAGVQNGWSIAASEAIKSSKSVSPVVSQFITQLGMAMDEYARGKTGAAFTESEQRYYDDLFGANQDISAVISSLNSIKDYMSKNMGSNYVKIILGDNVYDTYFGWLIK